jgi:hypothetical protein
MKIMPLIQTWLAQSEGACVHYVAVSCCLPAKQMAKSTHCKLPFASACHLPMHSFFFVCGSVQKINGETNHQRLIV